MPVFPFVKAHELAGVVMRDSFLEFAADAPFCVLGDIPGLILRE